MANTPFTVPRLVDEGAWLDWRGKYPKGYAGFGDRALANIRFAVPHHSVTNPTGNAEKDVNTLYNIHANNGWGMIGYNFVITSEEVNGFAKVAYVGDIGSIRAHTPNSKGAYGLQANYGNHYLVAACIIGQNHLTMPTQAQLRSMKLLMQEMLWFEDQRLPNLTNTWDDMREHKVWDWTQCNGMDQIRSAIINATIPPKYTPAPPPVWIPMDTPRSMRATGKTVIIDLDTNKQVGTIVNGLDTPFLQKKSQNGKLYLRSKWSVDNKKNWGVDIDTLTEIPVVVPEPEKPKPIVRALGQILVVKVGKGDKVVDVVTGKTTKEYTADERFEATHTIEFAGKKYYGTKFAFEQFEKGKNPSGVDVSTVEAWVEIPEAPVIPPTIPKDPVPVDPIVKEEHDKTVEELKNRVSTLEKIVNAIVEFLSGIFSGFKK
jgi:hypothetical protein